MEQQHQSLSEQQIKAQQKTSEKQAEQPQCCPNCGHLVTVVINSVKNVAWRLKELHVCVVTLLFSLIGKYALIADKGLHAELCSFCGASMEADDFFCPDCGNLRTGIICPDCNTLNFHSFCRKCNRPLNEMAMQEMQKAKKDPCLSGNASWRRNLPIWKNKY